VTHLRGLLGLAVILAIAFLASNKALLAGSLVNLATPRSPASSPARRG
jgi:hypothetical protein